MMQIGHPVRDVAYALVLACTKHLPDIEYRYRKPGDPAAEYETRHRRPEERDVDVYCFPQVFSDTTLGKGGIGGQAITNANTVVILEGQNAAVYRAGDLDYIVKADEVFWELLRAFALPERVSLHKSSLKRVAR